MIKTEVLCDACSSHFILVSKDEQEPASYCPYCGTPFADKHDSPDTDLIPEGE